MRLDQMRFDIKVFFSHWILVLKANLESKLKHAVFEGFTSQTFFNKYFDE